MPKFGKTSLERLSTCHPHIRYVLESAIVNTPIDFTVVCGHRDKAAQEAAFNSNPPRTTLHWPHSKHNTLPSIAVDIAPWWKGHGIVWKRRDEFIWLAGWICGIADQKGIKMIWGGNWDNDQELISDQTFIDLPHLELVL